MPFLTARPNVIASCLHRRCAPDSHLVEHLRCQFTFAYTGEEGGIERGHHTSERIVRKLREADQSNTVAFEATF